MRKEQKNFAKITSAWIAKTERIVTGGVGCSISTYSALEWLIQFGKSEHAELTRWHDPKEELPEYVKVVEVKYKAFGKIMMAVAWRLGCLDCCEDAWYIDGTSRHIDPEAIIGWREIHE